MQRKPIGKGTLYTEVCARVVIRLVEIDYRKNPMRYHTSYRGVDALGEEIRRDSPSACLFWFFVSLSKFLLAGGNMVGWREWVTSRQPDSMRSLHKRPFRV